jgi:hypothetical protein
MGESAHLLAAADERADQFAAYVSCGSADEIEVAPRGFRAHRRSPVVVVVRRGYAIIAVCDRGPAVRGPLRPAGPPHWRAGDLTAAQIGGIRHLEVVAGWGTAI